MTPVWRVFDMKKLLGVVFLVALGWYVITLSQSNFLSLELMRQPSPVVGPSQQNKSANSTSSSRRQPELSSLLPVIPEAVTGPMSSDTSRVTAAVDAAHSSSPPPSPSQGSTKTLLYFHPFYHMDDWNFGFGSEPFLANNCSVTNCYITNNRSYHNSLADFDALLFHARGMEKPVIEVPNQKRRRAGQRYVFFCLESPFHDGKDFYNPKFHNFFNWTMTYRLDSDIPYPYGYLESRANPGFNVPFPPAWETPPFNGSILPIGWTNGSSSISNAATNGSILPIGWTNGSSSVSNAATNGSRALVAWVVSHCKTHSKRETYVEELKHYIAVDIFGDCGDQKAACPKDSCFKDIEQKYKFYLSFENSICAEYITEKFWNILKLDLVPIVYGGGNYSRVAPPHSYINTQDFTTPRQLAEYLHYLDAHPKEYQKYFWWKAKYRVPENDRVFTAQAMCRLCEMLHSNLPAKVYSNLGDWWENHTCKTVVFD